LFVVQDGKEWDLKQKWSTLFVTYLTEQEVEPVRKFEKRLYIYGYVKYRDVFDRNTTVGFAYHLDAKGTPSLVTPDEAPALFTDDAKRNDAI
jgi:hypothetical protein